jgi:hypothetical protein
VVIFTVWGANIGDKIAEKIPKRSDTRLSSLGRRKELLAKVKLPSSEFILDMPAKRRISDSVKAELSGREFILPDDLPIDEVPQWVKRRLVVDWGIGDAEIEVDKDGKVTHFTVSAKEEGLSSLLSDGNVALPVECKNLPSGLVAGDVVKIFLSNGQVIEEAEVMGVNNGQNIVTIFASFDWIEIIRGNKADFLVALPRFRQKQMTTKVRRRSEVIEEFKAEKIYNSLKKNGINDETAKQTVSNVESRLLKIDGPVSTGSIESIIIEELEMTKPEDAKKLRKSRFWRL